MSSPDALPFLLVHGDWLWMAAVFAFTTAMMSLGWLLWRFWPRDGEALPPLPDASDASDAPTTVEELSGVLVGPSGSAVASLQVIAAAVRYSDVTLDLRPAELHLQTDDGRKIELQGELRVLTGSRAAVGRAGVPRALPRAELAELQKQTPWLHYWRVSFSDVDTATLRTLAPGDRVIARGVLERGPSSEETDFRTSAVAWSMRGVGEAPLQLAAKRAASLRMRPALPVLLFWAGLFGGIGYQLVKSKTSSWSDECYSLRSSQIGWHTTSDSFTSDSPFPFEGSHACIKAAASPTRREYELSRLADMLHDHPKRSEASLRRQDAVDRLRGACENIAYRYLELFRYEEARVEAKRCGARRPEHEALVALGRFEEAAALPVIGPGNEERLPTMSTLLAAGRWSEAASRLDAKAERLRADATPKDEADSVELTALSYQCLAALARHWAGEAKAGQGKAIDELRALRAKPYGVSCAPMLAELEGPNATNLEIGDETRLRETEQALDYLAVSAGLTTADPSDARQDMPEEVLASLDASYSHSPWEIWLTAGLTPGELTDSRVAVDALRWQAVRAVVLGDLDGARQRARDVASRAATLPPDNYADVDQLCTFSRCSLVYLPAVIELFTPSTKFELGTDPATLRGSQLASAWEHRYGRLLLRLGMAAPEVGYHDAFKTWIDEARRGNGIGLARNVWANRYRGPLWNDADVIAVLPRVREGREDLREALRWGRPSSGMMRDSLPRAAIRALARRTVMQLADLQPQAAMWNEILQRYDRVLTDRRKLLALMMYEL